MAQIFIYHQTMKKEFHKNGFLSAVASNMLGLVSIWCNSSFSRCLLTTSPENNHDSQVENHWYRWSVEVELWSVALFGLFVRKWLPWQLLKSLKAATKLLEFILTPSLPVVFGWKPVLPTLRFSRKFGLVFLWICVFLKTCGLLAFGLVLIKICVFFADFRIADCFFIKFHGHFALSIYCKTKFGRVFV